MTTNPSKSSPVSTAIGILIAVILLAVGLTGLNAHWYQPYRQFQDSASWESVPCFVSTMRVDETAEGESRTVKYKPVVEFSYAYTGKKYTSNRFWFGSVETTDKSKVAKATAPFTAEGEYECRIQPTDPTNAILLREINYESSWKTRGYVIAAGIGVIMLLGHFLSFLSVGVPGSTVSEMNYQRAMSNGTCPVESGDPDEPLMIEAAESRVAVATGLWIAGFTWTGIVSLISIGVLQSKDWLPWIILSAFFLVGIALLVAAFYTTLQIYNPRPILACSQRDIYPGSEFELSWMFHGKVKSIQRLQIIFEGIEKVTYRQGTSDRTEEKPFFRQQVVDTQSPDAIARGFELISIPLETMHSFQSANNSFDWQIRVVGQIAFWPDMRDRFKIVLLAPKAN